MPNNITNIITAEPHVLAELLDENEHVDFNKIIPMPMHLRDIEYVSFDTPEENNPLAFGRKEWNSKWNAYSSDFINSEASWLISENTVKFNTAWNHPFPVIKKWAQDTLKSPEDGVIRVAYASEDNGYNLGVYYYFFSEEDGALVVSSHDNEIMLGSALAKEIAWRIRTDREESYSSMLDTEISLTKEYGNDEELDTLEYEASEFDDKTVNRALEILAPVYDDEPFQKNKDVLLKEYCRLI